MSYDNTIPSADELDFRREYDRGFEAGLMIHATCKLTKEPELDTYACSKCSFIIYLENYVLEDQEEVGGYRFCGGCGAKITEVEK